MKRYQIYLAGACAGLTMEEQNEWREYIKNNLESKDYGIYCVNPVEFFNYENKYHKTEKEIMNFDLNCVRNADLIIVNLDKQNSIGTAMELAVAYESRIPIVGLNETLEELHPWFELVCCRVCDTMDELIDYVCKYYVRAR